MIDPEGIVRFAVTYPLEVGRNADEVQRIVKALKRAKELSDLKEIDRARELSKYSKQHLPDDLQRNERLTV